MPADSETDTKKRFKQRKGQLFLDYTSSDIENATKEIEEYSTAPPEKILDAAEMQEFLLHSPDFLSGDPLKRDINCPSKLDKAKPSFSNKLKMFRERIQEETSQEKGDKAAMRSIEEKNMKKVEDEILSIVRSQGGKNASQLRDQEMCQRAEEEEKRHCEQEQEALRKKKQMLEDKYEKMVNDQIAKSIDCGKEEWTTEDFKSFYLIQNDFLLVTDICSSKNENFKNSRMQRRPQTCMQNLIAKCFCISKEYEQMNMKIVVLRTEKNVSEVVTVEFENIKVSIYDNFSSFEP